MIFRRYEIRSRSLLTGEDLHNRFTWERFFFLRNAERACKSENMVRLILGAKSFEYYVKDRRDNV